MTGAAFFVEPSTGERRPLSHPGDLSINCVFNQVQYTFPSKKTFLKIKIIVFLGELLAEP